MRPFELVIFALLVFIAGYFTARAVEDWPEHVLPVSGCSIKARPYCVEV
jgi:hypothetical protein